MGRGPRGPFYSAYENTACALLRDIKGHFSLIFIWIQWFMKSYCKFEANLIMWVEEKDRETPPSSAEVPALVCPATQNNMRNLEYLYSAIMWRHGWEEKSPRSSSFFMHVWDILAKMCLQSGDWLERSRAEMQMMAKRKGTVELGVDVLAHLLKLCVRTQKNKANIFLFTVILKYHWKLQWLPQFWCLSEFFLMNCFPSEFHWQFKVGDEFEVALLWKS